MSRSPRNLRSFETHMVEGRDSVGDRFVEEWRECCRFASVSAEGHDDLFALAAWLEERAGSVFDHFERVDVPGHAPVLIGELQGSGDSRLLLYSHYDVQPAGGEALWVTPPFAAAVLDGKVVARGCCDDKSDVMARLHALEVFLAEHGRPRFSVVWLCEGAEEIGSPGLRTVLEERRDRLRSDACLWESYLRRPDGRPEIAFGCRGILYIELRLRLLDADRHGTFSSVYRSASVELVRALASIVGDGHRVGLDGFYDDVRELEATILETSDAPAPDGDIDAALLVDADPREYARRLLFEPSISIAGLEAGFTGPGIKTILPASARAKLDTRLLPDQEPEEVLRRLRTHLDRRGFQEVEIIPLAMVKPAVSPADTPLAAAVLAASSEVLGTPVAYPVAGAGAIHLFTEALDVPVVMPAGTARSDGGIHAPNESACTADYLDHVCFTVRLFEFLHDRGGLT
jgi:acetylornithine deacetylase/succinyl-diaminopimelate desuccinylase-like protein